MAELTRVAVIGAGYVGLTTAVGLGSLGHDVTCADKNPTLVSQLLKGHVAIREPGLAELVSQHLADGRLKFVVNSRDALAQVTAVFLCLPTPPGADGTPDVSAIESVGAEISSELPPGCVLVIKSTVPPGTSMKISSIMGRPDVSVVSNPEFLREGSALSDFLQPDRIVVGADCPATADRVAGLYAKLTAPAVLTTTTSAEVAKYAANCFLALKVSFVNEIAELCERFGADIAEVVAALSHDGRIGASYLSPGPGWGGPCLSKDTRALLHLSATGGSEFGLLRAALVSNEHQHRRIAHKIRWAAGGTVADSRIGLLGLTFKAGTGDLRDSPALAVAALLADEGAHLTAYDPAIRCDIANVRVVPDPYQAISGAAVVVLLTDWPQFRSLDWTRVRDLMAGDTIVDTRNHLDSAAIHRVGMRWHGIGRGSASTTAYK